MLKKVCDGIMNGSGVHTNTLYLICNGLTIFPIPEYKAFIVFTNTILSMVYLIFLHRKISRSPRHSIYIHSNKFYLTFKKFFLFIHEENYTGCCIYVLLYTW